MDIIDIPDCKLNHYTSPPRQAGLEDHPTGLCWSCLKTRSYRVQETLGSRYHGTVTLGDGTTFSVHGFTNAGFRGIEFYVSGQGWISAGRIVI